MARTNRKHTFCCCCCISLFSAVPDYVNNNLGNRKKPIAVTHSQLSKKSQYGLAELDLCNYRSTPYCAEFVCANFIFGRKFITLTHRSHKERSIDSTAKIAICCWTIYCQCVIYEIIFENLTHNITYELFCSIIEGYFSFFLVSIFIEHKNAF